MFKRISGRSRGVSGFTLIELLVVIAVIAILAAILFPVFAQVREKGRQAADLSNEKQIGLAFLQYEQDYDEYFPFSVTERYAPQAAYSNGSGGTGPSGTGTTYVGDAYDAASYSIRGLLYNYIHSNGVWHDPSTKPQWSWDGPGAPYSLSETATSEGFGTGSPAITAWFLTDYGFNFDEGVWGDSGLYKGTTASGNNGYGISLSSQNVPASTAVPHAPDFYPGGQFAGMGFNGTFTQASISNPSTFILGADSQRSGSVISRGSLTPQDPLNYDGSNYAPNFSGATIDRTQAAIIVRHSGGADFIYGDGHAKWAHPETTWVSATNNQWLRQQPY